MNKEWLRGERIALYMSSLKGTSEAVGNCRRKEAGPWAFNSGWEVAWQMNCFSHYLSKTMFLCVLIDVLRKKYTMLK